MPGKVVKMNWKRGLLRAWLVLAVCWAGILGFEVGDRLCANDRNPYQFLTYDQLIELGGVRGKKPIAAPASVSLETANALLVAKDEVKREQSLCFPDRLRIDWGVRSSALGLIIGPPIGLLILGYALLWIGRGFRR